jgi:hypothetical protein
MSICYTSQGSQLFVPKKPNTLSAGEAQTVFQIPQSESWYLGLNNGVSDVKNAPQPLQLPF